MRAKLEGQSDIGLSTHGAYLQLLLNRASAGGTYVLFGLGCQAEGTVDPRLWLRPIRLSHRYQAATKVAAPPGDAVDLAERSRRRRARSAVFIR
jgi:hypothetical protein